MNTVQVRPRPEVGGSRTVLLCCMGVLRTFLVPVWALMLAAGGKVLAPRKAGGLGVLTALLHLGSTRDPCSHLEHNKRLSLHLSSLSFTTFRWSGMCWFFCLFCFVERQERKLYPHIICIAPNVFHGLRCTRQLSF